MTMCWEKSVEGFLGFKAWSMMAPDVDAQSAAPSIKEARAFPKDTV